MRDQSIHLFIQFLYLLYPHVGCRGQLGPIPVAKEWDPHAPGGEYAQIFVLFRLGDDD